MPNSRSQLNYARPQTRIAVWKFLPEALLIGAFALVGCGEVERETLSLIDHRIWAEVASESDPFANRRLDGDTCISGAYHIEEIGGETALGIETLDCSFVTLWQKGIPIPSPSALLDETIVAPAAIAAGAALYFHVDNHGANAYNLIDVSKVP